MSQATNILPPQNAAGSMARPTKTEIIKTELLRWITREALQPNTRVLSQNAVARMFNVTQPTAHKALAELAQAGILYRQKGQGTFVSEKWARAQRCRMCLLLPPGAGTDPLCNPENWHISYRIMNYAREMYPHSFSMQTISDKVSADLMLSNLPDVDVFMMINTGANYQALAKKLVAAGRRVLLIVEQATRSLQGCCINIAYDRSETVRKGIHYLAQCGYRRIAFVGNNRDSGKLKIAGYRQALAELGLPYDAKNMFAKIIGRQDAALAARRLAKQWRKYDAIFVDTDIKAFEIMKHFAGEGIKIPEDIGLMGYDDLGELLHLPTRLTSLRVPYREMVMLAIQAVERAEKKLQTKQLLAGTVIPGATTANPKYV